jgi:23S rRNA (guanosine2251-2'-O)-methyltransferase
MKDYTRKMPKVHERALILSDIRSTYNVGALFRTADAVGSTHIYSVGITPDPIDRFGRKRADIAKAALGAEETVPWSHEVSETKLIRRLKKDGFVIVAVEQGTPRIPSKDYKTIAKLVYKEERVAFVFGNEVGGISEKTLALCDYVAEIPMKGKKESLNVSVSAGVALYRFLDR